MDPRSEVLLRQAELFTGNLLLAGLPGDDLLGRFPAAHGDCENVPARQHQGTSPPTTERMPRYRRR